MFTVNRFVKNIFLSIGCLVIFQSFGQQSGRKLTSYVNPFIGTGPVSSSLSGNNFPGATVPFGMVQLSPDTKDAPDWSAASGYDHNDSTIVGFSHTHLSGTGVAELFDVLMMPATGDIKTRAGNPSQPGSGYRSRFSHQQETAKPGYYSVFLLDHKTNVELTATEHAGFHRYTFPKDSKAHVVIDLDHSLKKPDWNCRIVNAQFRLVNNHAIEGYRMITGWAKFRKVYFYIEFSKPIKAHDFVDGGAEYFNQPLINGTDLRAILDFDTADTPALLAKVGLSAVSIANAKANLQSEIPAWDFDNKIQEAEAKWEAELQKIKVEGTEERKQIFYTSLYHALLQPNNIADVSGDYMAADYTIKNAEDKAHYSTFSLWDTYRGAHPLYTLIQRERSGKFVNSMIRQYETYGYLPVWQLWGQENYCMIGNHAIPVIVDAVLKGIPGFDIQKAYEAVKNSSLTDHLNSPFSIWEQYGYMPENKQSQSVSITLEMAYDDWCVAQFARKIGNTADYERFIKRSRYYKNLYDEKMGFFRAKDDMGKWMEPFSPLKYGANGGNPFTEGNAWQYFWYVPHDIYDLISLVGGDNAFTDKLDTFFTLDARPDEVNGNASGFIGQYAHGNEPSHHVTYLYNYAGQPWKTQYYVSRVLNDLYNTSFSGYAGNDDCGEMSAWYVFSAMGFYPVNPASGVYVIGSPALEHVSVKLAEGKTFGIKAVNASAKNIYIQSARLNGRPYTRTYITQSDIEAGGKLELVMGAKPNKNWGKAKADRPSANSFGVRTGHLTINRNE
ncbi:GH92 family glycosyl hydrolase [Pararcticibacter amylolyticus]|uniref:Glycoside hydrolase family 92 protein n=1 Tax=Pararcticibacter amylolyticus TaxID=2173175 RepID=A0A2U2PH20_9SPHI|nr:GH92 family glycosyl hydrolase [Pararcticibacter amylolyticus]PWG80552.1 glycoside hydrolase family 92 protein [Pararcticibacter amylolyticus]